jgi:hypothetical protein
MLPGQQRQAGRMLLATCWNSCEGRVWACVCVCGGWGGVGWGWGGGLHMCKAASILGSTCTAVLAAQQHQLTARRQARVQSCILLQPSTCSRKKAPPEYARRHCSTPAATTTTLASIPTASCSTARAMQSASATGHQGAGALPASPKSTPAATARLEAAATDPPRPFGFTQSQARQAKDTEGGTAWRYCRLTFFCGMGIAHLLALGARGDMLFFAHLDTAILATRKRSHDAARQQARHLGAEGENASLPPRPGDCGQRAVGSCAVAGGHVRQIKLCIDAGRLFYKLIRLTVFHVGKCEPYMPY